MLLPEPSLDDELNALGADPGRAKISGFSVMSSGLSVHGVWVSGATRLLMRCPVLMSRRGHRIVHGAAI